MSEHTALDSEPATESPLLLPAPTPEFAIQDWLIIVEALATCAGPLPTNGSSTRVNGPLSQPRTQRAWELLNAIIEAIDVPPRAVADRIDDGWRGPTPTADERAGE